MFGREGDRDLKFADVAVDGSKMDRGTIVKPNTNLFGGRSPNKCRARHFSIWVLKFW